MTTVTLSHFAQPVKTAQKKFTAEMLQPNWLSKELFDSFIKTVTHFIPELTHRLNE